MRIVVVALSFLLLAGPAPAWAADEELPDSEADASAESELEDYDDYEPELSEELEIDTSVEVELEMEPLAPPGGGVEEIVVTATKREQSLQDVPISVTALTSDLLDDAGLTDLSRLQEFVPNFKINPITDTRGTVIRIRGIGSVGNNAGIDPSVGVFIDGVYQGRSGMSFGDLLDIERIEVLRGPQGTLYGKNTAAGALNIYSKRPNYEYTSDFEVVVGDFDQYEARASLNFPVIEDRVATRFSGYWAMRDGFDDNLESGAPVNDANKYGGRLRTAFDVSENFSFLITGDYNYLNTDCCVADIKTYEGLPSLFPTLTFQNMATITGKPVPNADEFDRVVGVNRFPKNRTNAGGVALDATYEFGDVPLIADSTLNFLGSYRNFESDSLFDGDFSIYDAVLAFTETELDQYSGELRLTSANDELFEYVAGLYFYFSTQDTVDRNGFEQDFVDAVPLVTEPASNTSTNTHETTSYAAFGQATLTPVEWMSVTGGLRYTYEKKTREGVHRSTNPLLPPPTGGPTVELDEVRRVTNWSPMVALRFFPAEDIMVYASWARGFKSGGFNQLRTPASVPSEFDDEKSTNYELGLRTSWFDRRLQLNGTFFYTDYDEFQAQTFDGIGIAVRNAGAFESYGLEADLLAVPLPELTFSTAVGYNVTEYKDFPNAEQTVEQRWIETGGLPFLCAPGASPTVDCVQDLEGDRLDNSPRWTITTSIQYERPFASRPLQWFARAEHVYTSKQWLTQDLDDNLLQKHTNIYNLRLGLRAEDRRWELTGWVTNLTDEGYNVAGFDTPTVNGYAVLNAPPRQFGATLRLSF